ncbi:MAG: diacylglycerol kinase (ATP) [Glaciecola sp.]|jgi:diacylglycerol kinase (ATP)
MSFIKGRLKSFKYALKGAYILVTTEHSIMVQLSLGIGVTGLGFYYQVSKLDWIAQALTIGMVLCAEGLNSAIEGICDFVHPDHHEKIGKIKDIAAGAVTFTAIAALVVFCIIYTPYFCA